MAHHISWSRGNMLSALVATACLGVVFFANTRLNPSNQTHNLARRPAVQNIAAVSQNNRTPITPAPYTFAIWGLIYTGLVVYVAGKWVCPDVYAKGASGSILFVCSCLLNVLWLVCFVKGETLQIPHWRWVCAAVLGALSVTVHAHAYVMVSHLCSITTTTTTTTTTDSISQLQNQQSLNVGWSHLIGWVSLITFVAYAAWTLVACAINTWIAAARQVTTPDGSETKTVHWSGKWPWVALGIVLFVAGMVLLPLIRRYPKTCTIPVCVVYLLVLVWAIVGVIVRRLFS